MRDFQLWRPLLTIAKIIDENIYNSILKFAQRQAAQKQQDFVHETSLDYKILKNVKEKLEFGAKEIRPKDIRQIINQDSEFQVAEKTISTHLDKIGFKEVRERDKNGSFFAINEQLFEEVVMPICAKLWE